LQNIGFSGLFSDNIFCSIDTIDRLVDLVANSIYRIFKGKTLINIYTKQFVQAGFFVGMCIIYPLKGGDKRRVLNFTNFIMYY